MHSLRQQRPSLGLIGAGAFGAFAVPHLAPFFDVSVYDPRPDLGRLCARWGAVPASLPEAAACSVVVPAVPLDALRGVAREIAPHLRPASLVVDVCSVKVKPLAVLREELPARTRLVGTHPLFGPASGRRGIRGLSVVVCGRGRDEADVVRFFRQRLGLRVLRAAAEEHDWQMAYVQGLSHLVARSLQGLGQPDIGLRTAAFDRLDGLTELVGGDSAALFRTVVAGNPFAPEVLGRFLDVARGLLESATSGAAE